MPLTRVVADLFFTPQFTTGDVKFTLKAVADTSWIFANDGTIGNAASGGTTRANADTAALFALLWNNVTNANAAVSGGRGASATADFAANKNIALTKMLGRALGVGGAGSGLTSRALGVTAGTETHPLITAEMPAHTHTYDKPNSVANTEGGVAGFPASDDVFTSTASGSTGSGTAHNNMQPTSFLNVMIKL